MNKTLLSQIRSLHWKKEEEWAEKWYNTELTFRAFNRNKNPLANLLIQHSLNVLALNNDWYYQEDFTDEWGNDKTNVSQNLPLLRMLLNQEKTLIGKIEKIIKQAQKAENMDIQVFKQIEQGLTFLQQIFIIDLGAYIQPILDKQLQTKGLLDEQIQQIKDYYLLRHDTYLYQKEAKNLIQIAKFYRKQYGQRNVSFDALIEPIK